jgi:hypothetical protein
MRKFAVTVALTGGILAGTVGAPLVAAHADDCDAYSNSCPGTDVKGVKHTRPDVSPTNNSRLPFTGAEIALLSITGVGAVGAGAVLVTAGRRRRTAAA